MELQRFGHAEERRDRRYALIAVLIVATACHDAARERMGREAALRHDLIEMRKSIADFRADRKRGPHSLSELKTSHYLHGIPIDPITGSRNWRVTTEVAVASEQLHTHRRPTRRSRSDRRAQSRQRQGLRRKAIRGLLIEGGGMREEG